MFTELLFVVQVKADLVPQLEVAQAAAAKAEASAASWEQRAKRTEKKLLELRDSPRSTRSPSPLSPPPPLPGGRESFEVQVS